MFVWSVTWDPQDPVTCWAKFLRANPMLLDCFMEKGLPEDPLAVAKIIVETCQALAQDPISEMYWRGTKLVIGKPLVGEQLTVIACLCEAMGLAYMFEP
ncbi:hypothetical protein HYH03_008259 [Edaphochlamys debaryana]|uniref:Uncharacterized protein n=1 Tax=Edaphochlamys debaryana TaxID=47281 RepID=A0A835Y056_9CHLO|nr:hypothetical protein HYH03_008259 [Edaphochlamys debaryana]|eukprot:KAG2493441.1 hypothetical protein HYH03_008259 [Edaphochlamys debaryana]